MKKNNKINDWVKDYWYALGPHLSVAKVPESYLNNAKEGKAPVVLIPGLLEKYHFLKAIGDSLSKEGHPVYIIKKLGRNVKTISDSATIVKELINEEQLKDVIVVAHSKGGLIGKYLLAFENADNKIKKVIAIASPWKGSIFLKISPHKSFKELRPKSGLIKKLGEQKQVNSKIVSIYGISDNVVWPVDSCNLEGAKNIQVDIHGHHKILFDKKVIDIVMSEVEKNENI